MKPLVQKLPLTAEISFVAKTYRTPLFEVPWHQHIEYELILFTEGHGMCFVGNYVGEYKAGDVFFLGANLPHTFQKQNKDMIASAVVVQFRDDFWGSGFLQTPEAKNLHDLFNLSMKGIRIEGEAKLALRDLIKALEEAKGFLRISTLCNCLQELVNGKEIILLSTREMNVLNEKYKQRLDQVFQYTIDNFQQPVTLEQVARLANMSITAFCDYFKKSTRKSYIDFLIEIRISYACKLLQDTDKSIIDICYESGFNTAVNFNKQFRKLKKTTPGKYRNKFALHAY